jgi:radical SAM superfamily enzyme YgiQ (UPF0313 family)
MRGPGDILLVSCYEPGHAPQGIASAVAFLRRAGFDPACVDLAVEELDAAAAARLAAARLVVVSTPMHTALTLGLRVAARVRRDNPGAHLCFFGLYAELNQALLRRVADGVLGSDCEEALVALASALESGAPLGPALTSPSPPGRRAALVPERGGLPPLHRYARLAIAGEERVAGHVEATRGCKHVCRHCPIPPVYGGRFFAVPGEIVLEDARRQVAAGARHLDFGDPDFLNGPRHALRIARALHAEHPALTFSFTAKVEHLIRQRAALPELAALGALFVVSAVESLSDRVLAALDKGHRAADVPEALAIVRGAGLSLRPTFVPFSPWATLDDYLALCRFIRDHALEDEVDPVQLSIRLLVPPGSLLLAAPALAPLWGPLDEEGLTHRWTHPDPRMDRLEAEVAALVEDATRAGEAPAVTFGRIHRLAARTAGAVDPGAAELDARAPRRPPPPRLTEAWFCCAQPTRQQLGALTTLRRPARISR